MGKVTVVSFTATPFFTLGHTHWHVGVTLHQSSSSGCWPPLIRAKLRGWERILQADSQINLFSLASFWQQILEPHSHAVFEETRWDPQRKHRGASCVNATALFETPNNCEYSFHRDTVKRFSCRPELLDTQTNFSQEKGSSGPLGSLDVMKSCITRYFMPKLDNVKRPG